jgi:hypothetical protein
VAADAGNGEVLAQGTKSLGGRWRHDLEGLWTLWHNKEFINQVDLVKFILSKPQPAYSLR